MQKPKISLASDNWSPAHPRIIKEIEKVSEGPSPAYGADRWTQEAIQEIQKAVGKPCQTLFVPTGTGANVLALSVGCRKPESVLCSNIAHIHSQETGSAEAIVGCKLLLVETENGKVTPDTVRKKLYQERAFGKHTTLPRLLSLTQPTEVGTVYALKELQELRDMCRKENLLIHIDGSRLYNAAVSLNVSLRDIVEASGVDLLALGGTKNGLLGAEALLIFTPSLQLGAEHLQKQTLQLLSKMRYLSCQFLPFFQDSLWHTLASSANQKAKELEKIVLSIPELKLSYPVETNQVFFTLPPSWIPRLQEEISFYIWSEEKSEVRFITSWNTIEEEIEKTKRYLLAVQG